MYLEVGTPTMVALSMVLAVTNSLVVFLREIKRGVLGDVDIICRVISRSIVV